MLKSKVIWMLIPLLQFTSVYAESENAFAVNNQNPQFADCDDEFNCGNLSESAKRKLRTQISPAFHLDFDYGTQIVNLTPHKPSDARPAFDSVRDTLISGDTSGGYRATKYRSLEGGVGGLISFYYENATGLAEKLWVGIGILPFAGRELVSSRYAKTLKEAKRSKPLTVPSSASDIKEWSVGDAVSYAQKGGVIFSAGISAGAPVGVGSEYVVTGTFMTYVEKVSENQVYVRISNIDVRSLSVQVGTILNSIGKSRYKLLEQGMSYMINYKETTGARAYHDLVRGNVYAIQKLAMKPKTNKSVKHWEYLTRTQVGRLHHFYFGLPIIAYYSWSAGKIYELGSTNAFYNNTRSTVDYGIYMREKRTRWFDAHTVRSEMFYGTVYKIENYNDKELLKGVFGQYVYNAEDDHSKTKDLRRTIDDVGKRTGLRQQLTVNVPSRSLDYSKVNLEVNLGEENTLNLMKTVLSLTPEMLNEVLLAKTNQYFTTNTDPLLLCSSVESISYCDQNFRALAASASSGMHSAARKMKKYYDAGKDRQFALAYADFGKAMMSSAHTFQSALEMAGPGVEMVYTIEDTYFSLYKVKFITTNTPGKYKKSYGDSKYSFDNEWLDYGTDYLPMVFNPVQQ